MRRSRAHVSAQPTLPHAANAGITATFSTYSALVDLAFRVADETALEAHKINDIMWSRLRCVTACCVCLAGGDGDDSSERAFLAAKDGPPGFASYPGWLGWLDLG